MANANDVITKLDALPDCCFTAVVSITHPVLAQSVVCEKTHRVTWIGEEQGWHTTARPHRRHEPPPKNQPLTQGPYTWKDVVKAAGTTYRKLMHWCESGYIEGQPPNHGSGTRRRFTQEQIWRVKELETASRIKALPVPAIAFRLKPLLELERKARGIKDVPVQEELL